MHKALWQTDYMSQEKKIEDSVDVLIQQLKNYIKRAKKD